MRKAEIFVHDEKAGVLTELPGGKFSLEYEKGYYKSPISLTMPVRESPYTFDSFPPFFDGLLPEGMMLEGLLKQQKLDKNDLFSQLICVGDDLVGAVTVRGIS